MGREARPLSTDHEPRTAPAGPRRRRRWWRAVWWAVAATVLVVAVVFLRDRWSDVQQAGGLPGALPVIGAVGVNLVANGVLAYTWREVVAVTGTVMRLRTAVWIWAFSQLTRYTLSGAQVGGRAVLGRRYGLTLTTGGVTALIEIAWQLSLNGVLMLATIPWWLPGAGQVRWLAAVGIVPAALLAWGTVHPMGLLRLVARLVTWRPVARLTGRRLVGKVDQVTLTRAESGRLTALYTLNALLRFAGFLIVLAAVGGDLPALLARGAGAYALGQFVGRLAVFAPGGIGPREGVTALVMGPAIGGPAAVLLVAVVRLTEIAAELVFVALARLVRPVPDDADTTGAHRADDADRADGTGGAGGDAAVRDDPDRSR